MSVQAILSNGAAVDKEGPPAPGISTGGFFWRPADIKVMQLADGAPVSKFAAKAVATPAPIKVSAPQIVTEQTPRFKFAKNEPPLLSDDEGNVLARLQKRTFAGKGFNMIFRPRSNKPLPGDEVPGRDDNVLQLNLTEETQAFSESLGKVPNRGFSSQPDILLRGISYVQRVDDVANPVTGQADLEVGASTGIHFEPGVWLAVPKCEIAPPNLGPTICRMGSIPHGTTINAQGMQPNMTASQSGTKLAASIPKVDITPFFIGTDQKQQQNRVTFGSMTFSSSKENRIPGDLTKFDNKQVNIKDLLADPNSFLRQNLKDQAAQKQEVVEFIKFNITTDQLPTVGGGTANIAFLGGSTKSTNQVQTATQQAGTLEQPGPDQNAHAVTVTVTYWVETVRAFLAVKGGSDQKQIFTPNGEFGPKFVIKNTVGLKDTQAPVTWTQLQYSQNVTLNFAPLSWPHVSVATLAEKTVFDVTLRAEA